MRTQPSVVGCESFPQAKYSFGFDGLTQYILSKEDTRIVLHAAAQNTAMMQKCKLKIHN